MNKVRNYLSLVKFSHTLFALPFAMIGFFLGVYHQELFSEAHPFTFRVLAIKFILVLICEAPPWHSTVFWTAGLMRKIQELRSGKFQKALLLPIAH